jgi:hypothetical protein
MAGIGVANLRASSRSRQERDLHPVEIGGNSLGPRQFPITVGRLILIHFDSFVYAGFIFPAIEPPRLLY